MSESENKSDPKNSKVSIISRKTFLKYTGASALAATTIGYAGKNDSEKLIDGDTKNSSKSNEVMADDIVIENKGMRLLIAPDGKAKSLVYKPTNEEILMQNKQIPVFSLVQYDPYGDKIKANLISHGKKEFTVDSVYRDRDQLIARFDIIDIDAIIKLDTKSQYIKFKIEDFVFNENSNQFRDKVNPQVDEMWFLRLPVRNRTHFGNWLNVMWDEQLAVNILGAGPYTHIDSEERSGYRILKAGSISEVKAEGVGAALITTSTNMLLDSIKQVEEDFKLPQGVKNRRSMQSNLSSYWTGDINPKNIEKHINYAKKAGFRTFYVYYTAFSKAPGHYRWGEEYPNGIEDLQTVVRKIKEADMVPGVHIHYNKAGKSDKYVTPESDHRFNLREYFTLSAPLGKNETTIVVEENLTGTTLDDGRRILKIGKELISYSDYSSDTRPYKFKGCTRGALGTKPESYSKGYKFGLLDVDTWNKFIRFDQQTSIQKEVAKRMAEIYHKAGFEFVYFDGAEDVNAPYWFNTAKSQWEVYKRLKPEPILAGGAAMSHFSWHMLSRGNHYDSHLWAPEDTKKAIKQFPGAEAPLMAANFTGSTFGRYKYFVPGKNTIGMQPDIFEYLTSRAAGWDSPWILKSKLDDFERHPRTSDNLEVIKRWEDVKAHDWLTEEQKQMLRTWEQEHILLVNGKGEFELVPYKQIKNVAKGKIRAFIFERKRNLYVVYWHISDNKELKLPVSPNDITLLEKIGQQMKLQSDAKDNVVTLPASNRRYIRTDNLSREQLINALQDATIIG